MPLDAPAARAFIPCRSICRANKHLVGAYGEWVALVQDGERWYLFNVYTMEEIQVPNVRNVGIHSSDPFRYRFNMMHSMELLKI